MGDTAQAPEGAQSGDPIDPGEAQGFSTTGKLAVIATMIAVITCAHFLMPLDLPIVHDFMDRLYYFPIILAAFWFGIRGGLASGLLSMALYIPHIIQWELYGHLHEHPAYGNKYAEAAVFPMLGLFVGFLSNAIHQRNLSLKQAYL
ncbi:MAG: hypothetical protein ACYTHM_11385, partial [Planctomycetota bacterium]